MASSSPIYESFTAAAWLRWSDKDGDYIVLEQKGVHQAPFRLGNTADHGLVFTLTNADAAGATPQGVLSGVEPPVGEWFHLAGVYDAEADTATLYLNGTPIGNDVIGFSGWDADAAMTLGTVMRGDLDDVRVYQKALSADEVGALHGSTTTAAASPRGSERGGEGERDESSESSPRKTVRSSRQSAAPDPLFNYQHFTLDTCKAKGPKQYKKGLWTDASVYSGCTVRWYGMSIWVPDPEDIFGGKRRKTKKRPDGTIEEQTDLIWRSTVVVNTYLGMPYGDSIRNPGSDGTTGSLKPKDISVWVSLDNITPDHIAAGQQEMSLEMTAASSGPNSTCTKTVDGDWAGRIDEWGTRTQYYRFKSTSSSYYIRRSAGSGSPRRR